jgi:hypothetical protein
VEQCHQVDGFTGSGAVALTTSVDGQQPVCVFPQLGALYTTTFTGTVWGVAYVVGALNSSLPPALAPFQGRLCAILQSSWELYFTAFDGTSWSIPTPPASGVGTGLRPAMLTVDGTELWLTYTNDPGGSVSLMTYDGQAWTGPTAITGPNSAIGGTAMAELDGYVYLAYLSGSATSPAIVLERYDPSAGAWLSLGAVPTTQKPGDPSLTVWGDYLTLGYVDSQRIYTQLYSPDATAGAGVSHPSRCPGRAPAPSRCPPSRTTWSCSSGALTRVRS